MHTLHDPLKRTELGVKFVRMVVTCVVLGLGVTFALTSPAQAYPVGTIGSATINANVFVPGGTVIVNVQHTTPGPLTMQLFSAPVTIGTGTVGANGSGVVTGTIPAGYSGAHTIQVTAAGGEIYPFSITIVARPGGNGVFFGGCALSPSDGTYQVGFEGHEFPPGADVSLVANGSVLATVAAKPNGDVRLDGTLPVSVHEVVNASVTVTGMVIASASFDSGDCGDTGSPVPPTTPPTNPPTAVPSSAAPTATVVGSGAGSGGNLASTGARAGLGVGVGLATLLAGGLVLVASRRRTARH